MQTPALTRLPAAKRLSFRLVVASLSLAASGLYAQRVAPAPAETATAPAQKGGVATTTKEDDSPPILLTPFEVTAGAEQGYAAATTLAANRLNTNLRDVGSAISVVTEQFLRDTAAFNNETLLQYTTNTEVGSIYGNMSGAGGVQSTQLDETSRFVAPNMNTRVRGLATADNTIDYFLTDIPWDGYNVDRIDMQRGPNAILFGLGQPGGIINAGTRQAGFRTRGQIEARYSSFNSWRTTIDYNQVLIPKQLAARIDLLRNDEKFQQEPAYQRDERLYGALRFEPGFLNKTDFAHTTLKANYEKGHIRSNRPRSIPPGDFITPWFLTGTVNGFTATGAPATYNNPNRIGFDARGLQDTNIAAAGNPDRGQAVQSYTLNGVPTNNPYWQPWLGGFTANYFGNPMAIFDGGAVRYAAWEPNTRGGVSPTGAIDGNIAGIPFSRMSTLTTYRDYARKINLPGAKFGLTRNLVLTDPSVFNFYDNLIDGPNKKEWQNFDRFNVNLSQTFFRGNVGIEGAIDRQNYDNGQLVFMTDKGQGLYVDLMQVLADGTVNPNFGRPLIGDPIGNNRATSIDRASERITGFVKHDFAKERSNVFLRALGRHILTSFANHDKRESDTRGFLRYGTDLAYKDFAVGPTVAQNIDSAVRAIYPVIYLGPSLVNATSAAGANIQPPQSPMAVTTGSVRIFDSTWAPSAGVNPGDPWTNTDYPAGNARRNSTQSENPANYRGWVNIPLNVLDSEQGNRDALTTNAQLTKTTVSSKALVWNGYFWNGGLVGMYGWRRDTSKAWSYSGVRFPSAPTSDGQINLDPAVYRLPGAYRDRIDQESNSWSVVAHLSQLLPRRWNRLPVDVSLFYNTSKNFAATAGRVGPLNDPLGPPQGDTKDMGFVVATKDNKYSVRFNRYESRSQNASTGAFNAFYLSQFFTDYHPWFNVFKHRIDGNIFNLSGTQGQDPNRWTWQPRSGQTEAQAATEQTAAIGAWETLIQSIPPEFFAAYQMDIGTVDTLRATTPGGFTITEDNLSKGYEVELNATPLSNLRLTFNASKQEAFRSNIGPGSLVNLANIINTALNNTPAGLMRNNAAGTATNALTAWNNNFYAQYAPVKFTEGTAVPELRKWRANLVANYDFREGRLRGVNVGAGYRWQDKVVIGYLPEYLDFAGNPAANPQVATVWRPQLDKPFYGPAESNVDLWIGYRRALTKKITWRAQLNVRNVGKGNYLIPVNVQPDGTPVGYRIGPVELWSLSNSFEF